MEQCGDESLNISAWGSSGYFTTPNDIDLFCDLAAAAPGASFNASNFGSNDYGIAQKLDGSLNGGILHISAYYEDDEVMGEIYAAYEEMTESSDKSDGISFDDFRFSNDHDFGTIEKMDYDPVSREYI